MMVVLPRLRSILRTDLRLQFRHGFYAAYAVVTLIYAVGLNGLADVASVPVLRATAATLLFTDPSTLGAFFVGGLLLLEKQQGSLTAVFVTPLRPAEYLISKALSLTALALLTSLIMAAASGLPLRPAILLLSVAVTSVMFVMLGLVVAARVETVNAYFLAMVPVVTLPMLPALRFLGVETPLLWLVPTHASIRLLEIGLGGPAPSATEIIYAAIVLPAGLLLTVLWARRRFRRYVLGEGPG